MNDINTTRAAAIDTEAALVSAALMFSEAADEAIEAIDADDFADGALRTIFQAVRQLRILRAEVDLFSVEAELERRGLLAHVGGREVLVRLSSHAGSAALIAHHAAMVRGFAELRRVAGLAQRIQREASTASWDAGPQLAADFQDRIAALNVGKPRGAVEGWMADETQGVIDRVKASWGKAEPPVKAIEPKLEGLARIVKWRPGQTYVVAGRPGRGKTTVLQNLAVDLAMRTGGVVAYFSVEMAPPVMALRALSAEADVPSHKIEQGRLSYDDLDRLQQAQRRLQKGRVWLFHQPRMGIGALASTLRKLRRSSVPLEAFVVDYIQRIRPLTRTGDRFADFQDVGDEVLALAQQTNTVCFVGSQLQREGFVKMGDGPLEDAAALFTIDRAKGETDGFDLVTGKNRFGPERDDKGQQLRIPVGYDGATGRIFDRPAQLETGGEA